MLIHQTATKLVSLTPVIGEVKKIIPQDTDIMFAKTGHKLVRIQLNKILYFKGSGNYVTICTADQKYLVHNTMRAVEELVSPFQFVRIHKSYIVALQHIEYVQAGSILVHSKVIPVSESYRDVLQKFLKENAYLA